MPGGATGEFAFFYQANVGPAFPCQVIEQIDSERTAADDDDPCLAYHDGRRRPVVFGLR